MKAVDLFAGAGGFTTGATAAGVSVVWAADHWPFAVETHALNHPETAHECQDLRQADWTRLPAYDLLLASPACQGHSQASQPKRRTYHDAMRATAWAVVDCADVTEPHAIVVENVPDFRRWRLFPEWRAALVRLGYTLTELDVRASHHGVPQRRDRLFIVGTKSGAAPYLPRAMSEPAFGPCVDWTDGAWRPIERASVGARERIARAQRNHGPRCLVQHVTGHPGVPLDEPIRTVTTKDQWAVVDGGRYRPLTVRETARAMGFPADYRFPDGAGRRDRVLALGNAVPPPVARDVVAATMEAA
jgi:DNA (cytosine-5)-methyltransferase 1